MIGKGDASSATSLTEYLGGIPEWRSEETCRSLFSPFSQPRAVNPESYDARLLFWKTLLVDAARRGFLGASVFSIPDSQRASELLQREGIKPLGLAQVMRSMVAEGAAKLQDEESFEQQQESLLLRLTRLSLSWGWGLLTGGESHDDDDDDSFGGQNRTANDHEMAQALVKLNAKRQEDRCFSAISQGEFRELVQECRASSHLPPITEEEDFDMLTQYMREKNLLAMRSDNGQVSLKIADRADGKSSSLLVTKEECNILQLRSLCTKLQLRVARLSADMQKSLDLAKEALRRKDKGLARFELHRSKSLEGYRGQSMQALSTITEILDKIDAAHTSAEVFDAYRRGEGVLRSVLVSAKITPMDVDDVIVSLSEAMSQQDQISSALAMPAPASMELDEEALEAELTALVRDQEPASPVKVLPELPAVPRGDVGSADFAQSDPQTGERQLIVE